VCTFCFIAPPPFSVPIFFFAQISIIFGECQKQEKVNLGENFFLATPSQKSIRERTKAVAGFADANI